MQKRRTRTTPNHRNTDRPKPTPGKTNQNQDKKREKHRAGKRATTTRKKKTGAGRSLGVGAEHGVRVGVGVRVQDEETLGETQTPQGFVVPQRLRERERETERKREKRRRRTSQQPKKEREDNEHQSEQGAGLEGHQTKQHLDPRDQTYHTNKPDIYPESTDQKNQSPIKQSLGGLFTAGWRGPWAALHFWGDTPGDRSTEGYKYPPTTGTAPGGAKANNRPDTKLIPQKVCPSTWPFLNYRTRPQRTKQTQKDTRADM